MIRWEVAASRRSLLFVRMPPQECKICYEAVEVLAIWGKLFYNLVVCPGCGLLFLLQKTVTDFDGGRDTRGSRINYMGGVEIGIG